MLVEVLRQAQRFVDLEPAKWSAVLGCLRRIDRKRPANLSGNRDVDQTRCVNDPSRPSSPNGHAPRKTKRLGQSISLDRTQERGQTVANQSGLFESLFGGEHAHSCGQLLDNDARRTGHRAMGCLDRRVVGGAIGITSTWTLADTELRRATRGCIGRSHV